MTIADYEQIAQDIYDQHFNPKFVQEIPEGTETIICDYVQSFREERKQVDGDLLNHELLLIIDKEAKHDQRKR